jgi:hypothetical protein
MFLPRMNWMVRVAGALRALGPYAAIELLLPGGTLIALAFWVYRNRSRLSAQAKADNVAPRPHIAAQEPV